MQLRRRYITEAKGNKTFQKCLALVILLKSRLKASRIHQYSLNKLCKISGISHKTAEKYEKWLIDNNFVHFEGNDKNRVLIINSLYSHTYNRNIGIDEMDISNFFSSYRSVQAFLFMRLQHNKDFIKHLLQARHNPVSPEEYRRVKRKVKNLVRQGRISSVDQKYKEYGIGLKKISEEIGCCVRTAQRVTAFTLHKQWVIKRIHRFWYHYAPNVNYRSIDGYTFSTKHRLCQVHPNNYVLSDSISLALAHGMV